MRRLALLAAALLLLTAPGVSCGDTSPAGPGDDNGPDEPDPYSHTRTPGASAHDFLSDQSYTDLVVEVDYMTGYAPDSGALEQLRTFLEERLNKTTITIRTPTEIGGGGQQTYTLSAIRSLEEANRDQYTEGQTLTAYMLFVDGEFEQENVLGVAHYNTSSAYFGAAYEQASGGLGQPSRSLTEATSFRHELGHLFGLVAIEGSGTEMQTEHQDEANGHHCDNDQCLMYYAIESTDLFGSILGGEIPALDQNCIDDLRANGGK
jgi:hypothetical protein